MKITTAQKLLIATKAVMLRQGINATTVDDICKEANVSKMTFYRAYENKYDIIKEIIDENYRDLASSYDAIFDKNIPFVEKIMEIIYYNYKMNEGASQELINDIVNQQHPAMKDFMQEKKDFYNSIVLKYVKIEQEKGNFRSDLNLDLVSFYIEHINELVVEPKLQDKFKNSAELINQLTKMLYFGILSRG